MHGRVTVIVVNWNGEAFLAKCLIALVNQTVKPYRIVVIDNASTDNSLSVVDSFPEIEVVRLLTNTGFAHANNIIKSVAYRDTQWIALMNPDAFAQPDWLEQLLICAEKNPSYAAFGSQLLNYTDPRIIDGNGDCYHVSGYAFRADYMRAKHDQIVSESVECHEVFSPCAAAAMYSAAAFNSVGGFDEDFFCYLEDVDLGFRLRLAGYRSLQVPKSIAHHIGSATTGGQHSAFAVYHGHRNMVWCYVKNMPTLLFWLFLPLHVLINLASLARFTYRGQGQVIWQAKWDALKDLPNILEKRKHVKRTSEVSSWQIFKVMDTRIWPFTANVFSKK
jgi:GT2 family glycosyltransferase